MKNAIALSILLALSGCAHAATTPVATEEPAIDLGPVPDPHPASAAVVRAEGLIAADRVAEAVTVLDGAVAETPGDARAWFTLGVARTLTQDGQGAEVAFRRALAIDAEYAESWNELGLLLRAIGRSDEGIAALRRAIEVRADFYDAHYNLALALEDAGRLEEAREAYANAVRGPLAGDPVVRYNRAGLFIRLNDLESARQELLRARTLARGNVETLHAVGRALLRVGATEAAADTLAEAVYAQPDAAASLLYDAALGARAAARRPAALEFARRAAAGAPEEPRAQAMLALTAYEAGQLDVAREALARARTLDTSGGMRADLDRLAAQIAAAH